MPSYRWNNLSTHLSDCYQIEFEHIHHPTELRKRQTEKYLMLVISYTLIIQLGITSQLQGSYSWVINLWSHYDNGLVA